MNTEGFALPTWESFELLRSTNMGRLCVIEQAYPIAVPVNYRIIGSLHQSRIVFRTAPNSLLGRYQGLASLEVDHVHLGARSDGADGVDGEEGANAAQVPNGADADHICGSAWSVIVRGTLAPVHDAAGLPDTHPLFSEGRHQWLTLETSSISGRRFAVRSSPDGDSIDWRPLG